MKIYQLLLWGVVIALTLYIVCNLGFTNNSFGHFHPNLTHNFPHNFQSACGNTMRIDRFLFWGVVMALTLYVVCHLGFKNNTFENFVAGVDEYVETGGCYGNIKHHYKPSTYSLVQNPTSAVYGHTLPDKEYTDAPLDEEEDPLFMFGKNKCSPDCCPSTYTCSGGCVCTTEEQRNKIHGRQ